MATGLHVQRDPSSFQRKKKTKNITAARVSVQKKKKTDSDLVCECVCVSVCMSMRVCLHPGGLEVTDKSASGSINNSCCSDSAHTINTRRDLCLPRWRKQLGFSLYF